MTAKEAASRAPERMTAKEAAGVALQRRAAFPSGRAGAVHDLCEPGLRAGTGVPAPTPGQRMPAAVQRRMESAFSADFSDVRIHPGSARATALGAQAYTQGSDVHVAPGHWTPQTARGQELLGHELAHVVQQREGRVRATAQMKGVALNDEPALEAEADAMAARASRRGQPSRDDGEQALGAAARSPAHRVRASDGMLVQRTKSKERRSDADDDAESSTGRSGARPAPEGVDLRRTVYDSIIEHLKRVRPTLEDDDDIDLADQWEDDANKLREESRELETAYEEANNRKSRVPLAKQLNGITRKLNQLLSNIKRTFSTTEGGFSALGRASELDVKIQDRSEPAPEGYTENTDFTRGTTLGGTLLSERFKVFKKTGEERASDAAAGKSVTVRGKPMDSEQPPPEGELKSLEEGLARVKSPQETQYSGSPRRKERDETQAKAMGNTNATGYAWLAGISGWKSSRWEWLHVRAASLGGVTDSTNLVVGTRDANTHMIPFESHVATLARLAADKGIYEPLKVTFSVEGQHGPAKHRVSKIKIEWNLEKKKEKDPSPLDVMFKKLGISGGAPESHGVAVFDPVHVGSSLSKDEVKRLEETLKDLRQGLLDQE
ncbi:hypothetical protein BE04_20845 [Sorangium cellulosum]|uniref:eCIS core domain-containing protein n=1 Tax=Sorangium cellulosum TaxID=56 RepID=A0A150P7U3_SORCE|nr:hypothetical protein BE04_20845 [Sorangium cellulosum]